MKGARSVNPPSNKHTLSLVAFIHAEHIWDATSCTAREPIASSLFLPLDFARQFVSMAAPPSDILREVGSPVEVTTHHAWRTAPNVFSPLGSQSSCAAGSSDLTTFERPLNLGFRTLYGPLKLQLPPPPPPPRPPVFGANWLGIKTCNIYPWKYERYTPGHDTIHKPNWNKAGWSRLRWCRRIAPESGGSLIL